MSLRKSLAGIVLCGAMIVPLAGQAQAGVLGPDSTACTSGAGPAIRVNVSGLKDRTGELKLELYPATEADFLKDDRDLIKEGKFFRRVRVPTPQSGAITMCIKAPTPGHYALLFTHNRDGRNKFDFWSDGAGFPSNVKLGRTRPKLNMAMINVGPGVTTTDIQAQYLRGLGGFGPIKPKS
ncbi:DUF2141 domain-containing protein [Sphingomonas sp. QA11]|uniref:DUF2141 domain-containing protein n=1 Tax=Sphingomonas sp. QA11 TaxID=2950605 RepID=UPI00234B9806|nr:DUF2141 domain-containing protein [Sphingomonas sp. QA11]WCM26101.1 DUF2141 domain-containing protein [Sphingomonas sp. QA11]